MTPTEWYLVILVAVSASILINFLMKGDSACSHDRPNSQRKQ